MNSSRNATLIAAIEFAAVLAFPFAGVLRAQSNPSESSMTALYSAAGTAFNGSVNFAALGSDKAMIASGTTVPVSGVPCLAVTFSTAAGSSLQLLDQGPGWGGNFASGTPVLWTDGAYQGSVWNGNGPLILTFNRAQTDTCSSANNGNRYDDDKTGDRHDWDGHDWDGHNWDGHNWDEDDNKGNDNNQDGDWHNGWKHGANSSAVGGMGVTGVGFQIQSDLWGPFTATLSAYDSVNNLLFSSTFAGMSNFDSDNSAIFTGMLMPMGGSNIAKIAISSSDPTGMWLNDFAISGPMVKAAGSNVPSGIAGWWPLNDGSGIIAKDWSGGHDNGTLQGAAMFANDPQRGNVLSIDGVSGQVDMAFSNNLEPATGTVSIWVNPTQAENANLVTQSTDLLVCANRGGNFDAYSLGITNNGGATAIVANDDPNRSGKTPQIVVSSPVNAVNSNQWTNLVMRWDGSSLSLFVNGVKVGSANYNANPLTGLSYHGKAPLKVAAATVDANGNTLAYSGELSDLRIYSRALSDAEIQQLYAGQ